MGAVGLLNSCSNKNSSNQPTDTREQGTIHISVDESFKPVIDSQIQIYEASYPEAKIIAHYKPEADCLRDLAVDSIRLIITTRGFTNDEKAFLEDSMKVSPKKSIVAYDAVAVIVHPQSADSMFTMAEIKDLLTGKSTYDLTPVFDGVKATSTVRFVMDSVLRGAPLSPKVVAAQSSQGVIDYVAKTPKAIGFIGVSWVGNKEDTTQLSFLKKVKLANLESTDRPGGYVQPVQANIYYRRYPMVRDLTYILKERHQGLGLGFANFLTTQRGQLIFKRAYLMPAWMSFTKRDANLSE
ncbi:PstS family phosphate ABC transporter substrate-binding protein [Flavisolibacter tropicus]|uniref:PstS family phosphate ABC transporter substrate-binding protein n=1 Tax=Flavisolibacter tropicus TaxID=1492898 RepID=UPI001D03E13C|nr:substrate-binding domain-containing protein [Flavisolibacter tropicus]